MAWYLALIPLHATTAMYPRPGNAVRHRADAAATMD